MECIHICTIATGGKDDVYMFGSDHGSEGQAEPCCDPVKGNCLKPSWPLQIVLR